MPASTRLETKSLKMVFGARAVFARISCANWPELVASDLTPSASRAFSACCDLDFLLHEGGPFGGGMRLYLGQLELVGQLLFLGLGKLARLRKLIQLQPQRRDLIGLPLRLGFGRRQFLLRLFGVVLQLPVQILDVGLRGGDLLLQLLVFLLALAASLLRALRQLLLQLLAIFRSSSSACFITAVRSLPGSRRDWARSRPSSAAASSRRPCG